MEFANLEIAAVRETSTKTDDAVVELSELELVMVGGGTGDIHLG